MRPLGGPVPDGQDDAAAVGAAWRGSGCDGDEMRTVPARWRLPTRLLALRLVISLTLIVAVRATYAEPPAPAYSPDALAALRYKAVLIAGDQSAAAAAGTRTPPEPIASASVDLSPEYGDPDGAG